MKQGIRFFLGLAVVVSLMLPVQLWAGDNALSPEQKIVLERLRTVQSAINKKISSLDHDGINEKIRMQELYKFMQQRPELEDVGITSNSDGAWATVKGGGRITFTNNTFISK